MKNVVNKIKNILKDKDKMMIVGSVLVVTVLVLGLYATRPEEKNNEEELKKELTKLGKDFYENFYYDLVVDSNGIDQISKFSTVGIKANLNALEKYNSDNKKIIKKFVNSDTEKKCNKDNTKVIIYPKSPYKKGDYKIEIQLDCGFETEEK